MPRRTRKNKHYSSALKLQAVQDYLAGKGSHKAICRRTSDKTLNGRDLTLGENWELPDLSGDAIAAGKVELAPITCTFLVL